MLGHSIADVLLPLRDVQKSIKAMLAVGIPEGDIAATVAKTERLSRIQSESILLAADHLRYLVSISGKCIYIQCKSCTQSVKDRTPCTLEVFGPPVDPV